MNPPHGPSLVSDAETHRLRHILVADDEPHIRRVLVTMLEAAPFHVASVRDGDQALELLRDGLECDLVVTDLMMPNVDGLELLAALRKLPGREALPVIVLTAKGQDADSEKAYLLGASDFMTKPFSPKKLLARIRELLQD